MHMKNILLLRKSWFICDRVEGKRISLRREKKAKFKSTDYDGPQRKHQLRLKVLRAFAELYRKSRRHKIPDKLKRHIQ